MEDEGFSRPVRDLSRFWVGNPILKNGAIEQLSLAGQEMAAAPQLWIGNLGFESRRTGEGVDAVRARERNVFGRNGKNGNDGNQGVRRFL